MPPLMLPALQNCNQKMCEMLLRRNANINHQNVGGNTPLHFAMAYDQKVRPPHNVVCRRECTFLYAAPGRLMGISDGCRKQRQRC
jgi:hypothetical protein